MPKRPARAKRGLRPAWQLIGAIGLLALFALALFAWFGSRPAALHWPMDLVHLGADPSSAPAEAAATATAPTASPSDTVIPAQPTLGLSEWLAGHAEDWRAARLQENPAVLVIEFPSLAEQGLTMNRMAALLEKADAPRDRVLSDAELAALISRSGDTLQTFYQGHDYDGAGLARFYALVQRQGLSLSTGELRLRQLLLDQGLLAETPSGLQPQGTQAVITFTATQKDDPSTPADETIDARRRESVLRHEASHGLFYTRAAYREHCRRFWRDVLSEAQRAQFRGFLARMGYDQRNDELMLNETQAFLMHTPDTRAFNAQAVGLSESALTELRNRFWRSLPAAAQNPEPVATPSPAAVR